MSFEDINEYLNEKQKSKTNDDIIKEINDRKNREVAPDNRQEIESKNVNEKTTTNPIQKNINEDELPNFEDEGM